jgi:hypothetical protein
MTFANANPEHLEELARRLDGNTGDGGAGGDLSSMFTRASNLNASDAMSSLQPLQTWVTDTAPDLRNRAGYVRLDEGDPTAGLRLAGFSTEDIAGFDGDVPAGALVMANTLAANGNGDDDVFQRQHREEIDEYLARIAGHYAEQLPGLEGHGETVASIIEDGADWVNFTAAATVVGSTAANLYRARAWNGFFLNAPKSWLPGQLGTFIRGNPTVNRLMMIPGQTASRIEANIFGRSWDWVRNSRLANTALFGITPNNVANFVVGNDRLATALSFKPSWTTAERIAARASMGTRAANARLDWVARNSYSGLRALGNTRWASTAGAAFNTARASGALRFLGVAGGAVATGFSVANLVAQGNPVDAWNEANGVQEKAGYLADWAEVGFNASLTAAMVAPTPWTVGAAAVTGVIYGGLKVVEHWDDITNAVDTAADWTGDRLDDIGEGIGNAAESVGNFVGDLF